MESLHCNESCRLSRPEVMARAWVDLGGCSCSRHIYNRSTIPWNLPGSGRLAFVEHRGWLLDFKKCKHKALAWRSADMPDLIHASMSLRQSLNSAVDEFRVMSILLEACVTFRGFGHSQRIMGFNTSCKSFRCHELHVFFSY